MATPESKVKTNGTNYETERSKQTEAVVKSIIDLIEQYGENLNVEVKWKGKHYKIQAGRENWTR